MFEFNKSQFEVEQKERKIALIPKGKYRVRIEEVITQDPDDSEKPLISSSGNSMVKLVIGVSGINSRLWHYIVEGEWANKNIGNILDSCGLMDIANASNPFACMDGASGAVAVKHERNPDYNEGEPSAKIHYWIPKDKQEKLPGWEDPDRYSDEDSPTSFSESESDADIFG